nr:flagellar assembly protein FliH [Campylobacter sp.]
EISKNLIKELENSSDVEIKVNPEDFEYLQEKFNGKVKLTSDDAISKGGAVVLSKSGNIDGNLLTRFEKIQKILKE